MSTSIEARHARSCTSKPSNGGGRCNCDPSYQAHVWDAKVAKRIRKTFSTRTGAKQWRHDAMSALRSGGLSADRGPLLSDAAEAWLDGLRAGQIANRSGDPFKPVTVRDYDRIFHARILPALGHLRLAEITPLDVQRFVDDLVGNGHAPATIDAALTPLRAFFRRAAARGEARANPTLRIEKPGVRCAPRSVVSPVQAAAMIDALDGADRVLWATAFYTGMCRGELTALRREDVDLATGIIHVRRGWDEREGEIAPKSRNGRRKVPVAAVMRDHLDQHLLEHGGERVFASRSWIAKAARRAGEVWEPAGLPTITLHAARHTFASFAIATGMNAKTLCVIMGHADIATTYDKYGHLLPGSEDEAAARLDAYFAQTVAQTVAHPEQVAA
jgi:integrase